MAVEGLQVDQLERELQRMKAKLDGWASKQQNIAHDVKDQHAGRMKEHSEKVHSLRQSKQQLATVVEHLHARLADEDQQLNSMHATAATVRSEQEVLQRQLHALQDALHMQEVECLRLESDMMVEENKRSKRTAALKKLLNMYATNLGLEFRQGSDELLLVMTQIDYKDPKREFKVAVRILPDNTYKVTRCAPEVSRLPELLAELNSSNNFSHFISALRKEFQHLVEAARQ